MKVGKIFFVHFNDEGRDFLALPSISEKPQHDASRCLEEKYVGTCGEK